MTRAEHLEWCKQRALEYAEQDMLAEALSSMASDLTKHPETLHHNSTSMLGFQLFLAGDLNTPAKMGDWIRGFN